MPRHIMGNLTSDEAPPWWLLRPRRRDGDGRSGVAVGGRCRRAGTGTRSRDGVEPVDLAAGGEHEIAVAPRRGDTDGVLFDTESGQAALIRRVTERVDAPARTHEPVPVAVRC